jgi:L-fuculose-phosphate aldolase
MKQNAQELKKIRRQICDVGRYLYNKSYISGTGGNISVRLENGTFLITPSKCNKGFLAPEDIALIDSNGKDLAKGLTASSEKLVHLCLHKHLPNVGAVIHAHPPAATAHAMVGRDIDCAYAPETMVFLGDRVPYVPYETPSTHALSDSFKRYLDKKFRAYLMGNHGVAVVGRDLQDAYNNIETLELYARTLIYAKIIGTPKPISPAKVKHLKETFGL